MKKKSALLILPLLMVLAVALVVAACGDGGTTSSSAGGLSGSTETTAAGSTTSEAAGGSSTTVAGMTSTTAAGGAGIPNNIAVQLTGAEEVPPTDTGATGTFTLVISMGGTGASDTTTGGSSTGGGLIPAGLSVSYKLEVSNIKDVTAAHIHLGAKGQNGDVIYPLYNGPQKNGDFSGVLAEGPLDEANLSGPFKGKTFADLVTSVLSGQTYVNVHSAANPNGEIRGQLILQMGGSTGSTEAGATGGATTTTGGSY